MRAMRLHTTPFTPLSCALHLLLVAILSLLALCARAQSISDPTPLKFQTSAEEQRFHVLVRELRCVQCQNQSLADSNAQIARDLRREVLEMMQQGRSDGEIKDFLVQRYGEFVLYRPPFSSHTWLLWLAPAFVVMAGTLVIIRIAHRRAHALGGSDAFLDGDIDAAGEIEEMAQMEDIEETRYARERE